MTILTAILALTAAAVFGFNVHVQRHGLDRADPFVGAFLSVASMTLFFWCLAPFFIDWSWWRGPAVWIFLLGGLFFPATGQSLQILSIRLVGPALTSAIGAFTPFFGVVPAFFLLDEEWSLQLGAGMVLMTAGLVLAVRNPKGMARGWPLWALMLPLTAAAVRGVVQPMTGAGMALGPNAFFATLVYGTVSTLVLALVLGLTGRLGALRTATGGRGVFAMSGVINGVGILALMQAIGIGGVATASPLAATAPLWALGFGAWIFRREQLGPRHLWVAALAVMGAVLILLR